MQSRYKRPPAGPPSGADIRGWLRDAQLTIRDRIDEGDAAVERRHAKAVGNLIAHARAELLKADEKEGYALDPLSRFGAIPAEVKEFLMLAGLRILLADDPAEALQRFIGKRKRGERSGRENEYRDIRITARVVDLIGAGKKRDDACIEVGKEANLSPERVKAIYNRGRDTELEWRKIRDRIPADRPAIEGQEITSKQFEEYSELARNEYPGGMTTEEESLELWSRVRRASFPSKDDPGSRIGEYVRLYLGRVTKSRRRVTKSRI